MLSSIIAGLVYQLAVFLSPAPGYDPVANEAYTRVLGVIPRVLVGGWLAVFSGEITNNFVLAKMKIFTGGRYLWTRTIGSTVAGQFVNTAVFYFVALYGIIPLDLLYQSIVVGWIVKSCVEIVSTPLTYIVVGFLKKAESEDYYDRKTDFNPFILNKPGSTFFWVWLR